MNIKSGLTTEWIHHKQKREFLMYYLSFFDICPLTSSMYMQTKSMARLHPPIRQKDRIPVNRLGGVELGMGVIIPDNIDCIPNKHANESPYHDVQKMIRFLYKGIIINQNKKLSQPTLKRRFFKKKAAFFS